MAKTPTATHTDIIRAAVALASKSSVDHLLYVGDLPLPDDVFLGQLLAGSPVAPEHVVRERQIADVEQVIDARLAGERNRRADDVGVCRRRCLGHVLVCGGRPMLR